MTLELFSAKEVESHLHHFFSDSLICGTDLTIKQCSPAVAEILRVEPENLIQKPLLSVMAYQEEYDQLMESFVTGFTSQIPVTLIASNGRHISVELSLIHAGFFTTLDHLVIIRVHSMEEKNRLARMVMLKNLELDQVMYRISHDLRGPLASIMGLAMLAKRESDPQVLKDYFEKVDHTSSLMDSRLRNLNTIFDSKIQQLESCDSPDSLQNVVYKTLQNHPSRGQIRLGVQFGEALPLSNEEEVLITQMVYHFGLFIACNLQCSAKPSIKIKINNWKVGSKPFVRILIKGFMLEKSLLEFMRQPDASYMRELNDPARVYWTSFRKLTEKNMLHLDVQDEGEGQVRVLLRKDKY